MGELIKNNRHGEDISYHFCDNCGSPFPEDEGELEKLAKQNNEINNDGLPICTTCLEHKHMTQQINFIRKLPNFAKLLYQ